MILAVVPTCEVELETALETAVDRVEEAPVETIELDTGMSVDTPVGMAVL